MLLKKRQILCVGRCDDEYCWIFTCELTPTNLIFLYWVCCVQVDLLLYTNSLFIAFPLLSLSLTHFMLQMSNPPSLCLLSFVGFYFECIRFQSFFDRWDFSLFANPFVRFTIVGPYFEDFFLDKNDSKKLNFWLFNEQREVLLLFKETERKKRDKKVTEK